MAELNENKQLSLLQAFRASAKEVTLNKGAAGNNKSIAWFKSTIASSLRTKSTTNPVVGRMYAYVYDAKAKDTLPYWDRFPLIIALNVSSTHILGLNLHYVSPQARIKFMERLLPYASAKTLTPTMKLRINWDSVKSMPGADHMIKLYLKSHLKSVPVEVPAKEWYHAIGLPLQQFMSGGKRYSARKVWGKR